MSYTGSKSQVGAGTTVKFATVLIGEITDIAKSGAQMGSEDSTNLDSASEEFIKVLMKPGTVELTVNRVGADTGQTLIETDFPLGTIGALAITLPKTAAQTTTGDSIAATAMIEEFNDIATAKARNIITSKIKFKIQGGAAANPWVRTAGS